MTQDAFHCQTMGMVWQNQFNPIRMTKRFGSKGFLVHNVRCNSAPLWGHSPDNFRRIWAYCRPHYRSKIPYNTCGIVKEAVRREVSLCISKLVVYWCYEMWRIDSNGDVEKVHWSCRDEGGKRDAEKRLLQYFTTKEQWPMNIPCVPGTHSFSTNLVRILTELKRVKFEYIL